MNLLLGIDAGTTSVKAGLFTPDGRCLGIERQEYQLETPGVERAQLDPNLYWQACINTVRKVLTHKHQPEDQVIALAVSSQGETLVSLDKDGLPVYPAIVWLDNRAVSQAQYLSQQFQEKVYQHTGIPEIVPTWTACKILWLKENEPDAFAQADKFLLVQDYLIYKLTGRYFTDGSIACTTMNFDIVQNKWWGEMLYAIGVKESQLPHIVLPGTNVSKLNSQAARDLGLEETTMVVTGGMDQSVGAIGAGNYKSSVISETTGGCLALQVTIDEPFMDKKQLIPVYFHSVPGKYLLVPVSPTGGIALKWFRDQFGQTEVEQAKKLNKDSYDLLTALAESAPAGSDGLIMLPHLMGAYSPDVNPSARGAFVGFTLSHTRSHFARATLEGVAFLLRRNLDALTAAGISIREIIATGGGSRSRFWNQIKANICNLPVISLENEETALQGDAILAGVAAGIYTSIEEGCQKMVVRKETFMPNQDAPSYQTLYSHYCDLDLGLSDYFKSAYQNGNH